MTDPTMCSEYERYVNLDFVTHLHPKEFATFDVLGFWKEKETMYPVLSRMAMDIISVQASSVASESAFSTSERVLSIRRTRLTPASLEMCMCLKDHLDAKERKQDKSPLEIPLDFEEDVLDDEADSNLKGKFWGRSIQLHHVGVLTLQFKDGETFQWSKVTTSIYNIILGKIYCDYYGTMRIKGSGNYSCKIKFKEQSIIDRNPHQVHGFVHDNRTGEKVAMLMGKWDEAMYYVLGDPTTKPKGYDPMTEAVLLWERDKSATKTRYNLTPFAISLNEITPGLRERLPPTDSRLRPDQRHLENGEYELANTEKLRLEQLQRQARKLQERGWRPKWFQKDEDGCFHYMGGYWETQDKKNWNGIPYIFGQSVELPPSVEEA
ncbi:oxysterol-binding protein-related protein 1D [Tanacetum coccineum]